MSGKPQVRIGAASTSYSAAPSGNSSRVGNRRVTPMGQGQPMEGYFKAPGTQPQNRSVAALGAQLSAMQIRRRKTRKARKSRKCRR
jgi:hypothetical protein